MHICKLTDYFEITSSKRVFKSEWTQDGIPFYRAREIVKISKDEKFKDPIFISNNHYQEIAKKYGVPKIGDLLVTGVGTLGISLIIENEKPLYFKDGNIIWFKKKEEINSKYVQYYLNSPIVQKIINNKIGATVKTFTISDANNLQIPVPSLQEQEKIVERLDTFTKLKSNFISNIQMKYSMINNFFDFNFSDINESVNLEDLIVQIQYGTSKKSESEGKYPVLGMGNLDTRGVINFNKFKYTNHIEEFNKYKLEKEDVLFNRTNSAELVGKSAVFNSDRDCIFAGYLIKIKCDPNKLNPHYLTMFLNSKFGKQLHEKFRTQSTGQANISGSKLKKYKIPYVEIGVQNEIIKKREMLLSKINSLEILIHSQQELLETLHKSVFKKEFSYE